MTDLGCLGLIQSQFRLFQYDSRPISAYFGRFSQFWPPAYTIRFGQYDLILAKSAQFGVNRSRVSTNPKKKKKLIRSIDARAAALVATPCVGPHQNPVQHPPSSVGASQTRKHRRSSKVAAPESDTARHGVQLVDSPFFFLFFFIRTDSARFTPIRKLIRPKRPPKHADSGQKGHRHRPIAAETGQNGQRLPFFCFMWPCERNKKKEGRKR